MADRMVVLKEGNIHQIGTPTEIYNNPQDLFVASFIGTPAMNLIEDEISGEKGDLLPLNFEAVPDGKYVLGIRPEIIRFSEGGKLDGDVAAAEYIGAVIHLKVNYRNREINAVLNEHSDLPEKEAADRLTGRKLRFDIDPARVIIFSFPSGQRFR